MLKVDIRNRILKPKVGEIITVIGDIYTTVAETIPDENGRSGKVHPFNSSRG